MGFRERERDRQAAARAGLFSPPACRDGLYRSTRRDFCLHEHASIENLWSGIQLLAVQYFADRRIPWHQGKKDPADDKVRWPSNHLCCSQSACVNAFFPFMTSPGKVAKALQALLSPQGLHIKEVLPFDLDAVGDKGPGAVAFEWIGRRNYLRELHRGRMASDAGRSRGKGFTSADFAIRARLDDGRIALLLGEWKYTERYGPKSLRFSKSKTDRLKVYKPALTAPWCQVVLPEGVEPIDLFHDPFDQLMRLQLLASEIEQAARMGRPEMGADLAVVLHVAPRANRDLMARITSGRLKKHFTDGPQGTAEQAVPDIHEIWSRLAKPGRFFGVAAEDLFEKLIANSPDVQWAGYMETRYVPMK